MAGPKSVWLIDKFDGGLSDGSSKRAPEGSFRAGTGLDYRTDPDVLSNHRKLTKESGSTVDSLIRWFVTQGTNLWSYAESGALFKRITNGTWSKERTVSGGSGNGLAVFDDYLYYSLDSGLGRYGPLSGTPAFDDSFLEGPTNETDQSLSSTGQNYTATTAVNEGATHRQTFTPTVDNITGVAINLSAKGTGDITLTIHDTSNNLIGVKTIVTADLATSGAQRFMLGGIQTVTSGNAYHFHVHSTVADATIISATNADLEGARFGTLQDISPEEVDQSNTNVNSDANAYVIPTSIDEDAATARQTFVPEKTTQVAVSFWFRFVDASGDITVTVHDEDDTSVATSTVTNANLKIGGFNKFVYSAAFTAVPGATYHFHVTASAGTHNINTGTSADMEDLDFKTYYQILETDTQYHPEIYFPASLALVVGNGNFLARYDGVAYRTSGEGEGNERLTFSKEEKVRALALVGDYLAIGTWKGDSIDDHGESIVYFWDGSASTYNAFKKVTGEINAMLTGSDGLLYVWHGGFGHVSVYDGSLTLVHTTPNVSENKTVEIYPGAVSNWLGIPRFGISDGDSITVVRGLYSYGRRSKDYPISMNVDALKSAGASTGITEKIGAVHGIGPDRLFVAWQSGGTPSYGVDKIDTSNDAASAVYESMVFDGRVPHFSKKAHSIKLTFKPLKSGDSITVKYKINWASSWTTLDTATHAGDGAVTFKSFAFDKRFRELELQITNATTGADAPEILSIATFFDFEKDIQE